MRIRRVWASALFFLATAGATGGGMAFEAPVWPWGTNPVTSAPINGFCDAQQAILDNGAPPPPIPSWIASYLLPGSDDLNGISWVLRDPLQYSMSGNGWSDCRLDLLLIEEALRNTALDIPAHDTYAGLSHAKVLAALNANAAQMASDLGSLFGSLPDGWPQILLGHMIAGYGDAVFSDMQGSPPEPNFVDATGSAGFVRLFMFILNGTIADLSNYTRMPEFFDKMGDADGDGFSNECEYQYVGELFPPELKHEKYAEYALNPAKHPPAGQDCHCILSFTFLECPVRYQVGETLELSVDVECAAGVVSYEWAKDGVKIQDATNRTYTRTNLSVGDSGSYTCTAMDENNATFSATIQIEVWLLPALSAPGPVALGALIAALTAFGAAILSRGRARFLVSLVAQPKR
ncbi:MAG TPA: hypothetical protein PKO36_02480 [Candidatus Hydrogenedentes bacterium]|nr:hypothetical protein [Candidatus Hydrogenedentota bacterium]HOV76004.1 hypothetical protein [Candidatus Hydrogenedentota bacterium]HPC15892.1 hypothetical protein [Candidatus Hydrogenedentota bacterium]HRT19846.1 hypothetical protein [Candidatus Hydrogenedentota bacterium]HRT65426.1 hypothetical protein [Candidatus Hydrogenedentota bacterium]